MLMSLTACASGGSADNYYESPASAPAAAPDYEAEYAVAEDSGGGSTLGAGGSIRDGRKITFTASISMNTKQFDADYAKIYALIESTGGFVASETMTDNSSLYDRLVGRTTNISARIPAGDYDSFIDAVTNIADVTNKNKWSDDLTSEYFDTEARVELLEIRKDRLMGYLLEAENAEDIVAFERELSDVLYDLDFYQGNIRRMDRLVEYATVDINMAELITPDTIGKDGEPLGDRARSAFSLSLTNVGIFLEDFAVGFAGAIPVIVLIVIILLIIWAIVRVTRPLREKLRFKREARAAKRREKLMQQQPYNAAYWQQPAYQPPPPPQAPQPPPEPVPEPEPKKKK